MLKVEEKGVAFGDFYIVEEQLAGGGKALKAINPWNVLSVQQGGLRHNGIIKNAYNGVAETINFSGMKFDELLEGLTAARRASVVEMLGAAMVGKISAEGLKGVVRLLAQELGMSLEEACSVHAEKAVNATLDRVADVAEEAMGEPVKGAKGGKSAKS